MSLYPHFSTSSANGSDLFFFQLMEVSQEVKETDRKNHLFTKSWVCHNV